MPLSVTEISILEYLSWNLRRTFEDSFDLFEGFSGKDPFIEKCHTSSMLGIMCTNEQWFCSQRWLVSSTRDQLISSISDTCVNSKYSQEKCNVHLLSQVILYIGRDVSGLSPRIRREIRFKDCYQDSLSLLPSRDDCHRCLSCNQNGWRDFNCCRKTCMNHNLCERSESKSDLIFKYFFQGNLHHLLPRRQLYMLVWLFPLFSFKGMEMTNSLCQQKQSANKERLSFLTNNKAQRERKSSVCDAHYACCSFWQEDAKTFDSGFSLSLYRSCASSWTRDYKLYWPKS
jgi:hypothetical protein